MEQIKIWGNKLFLRYCIVFTLVISINVIASIVIGDTEEAASIYDIIMVAVMAFLCGEGDLIFYTKEELSKRQHMVRRIIHYIYINIVVVSIVCYHVKISYVLLFAVVISVALIYWINILADFSNEKKDAEKMTEKLRKINNNDE